MRGGERAGHHVYVSRVREQGGGPPQKQEGQFHVPELRGPGRDQREACGQKEGGEVAGIDTMGPGMIFYVNRRERPGVFFLGCKYTYR